MSDKCFLQKSVEETINFVIILVSFEVLNSLHSFSFVVLEMSYH